MLPGQASTLIQGRRARVVATSILNGQQATTDDSLSIRNLERQKPLLIVAEDVYSEVLATPILNRLRAGIKVILEDLGLSVENVEFEMQGTCKR
ncbi:hypothetical protein BC332_23613 [Capsicum chinense]|nr:hypothetical protein BC332_23613 [Capsicum chinense]